MTAAVQVPYPVAAKIADLLIGAAEGRDDLDAAVIREFRKLVHDTTLAVTEEPGFDGRKA